MPEISRSEETLEQTQANVKDDELALYEIGFHLLPSLSEGEIGAVVERIRSVLEAGTASIVKEEFPKKIQFTYRIERSVAGKREKYTEGYFGWIQFEAPKEAIKPLEESMHADRSVLRFLLIHTTPHVAPPQPRAVFSSDRLEGETIARPIIVEEKHTDVSEEELDKSLEALSL